MIKIFTDEELDLIYLVLSKRDYSHEAFIDLDEDDIQNILDKIDDYFKEE